MRTGFRPSEGSDQFVLELGEQVGELGGRPPLRQLKHYKQWCSVVFCGPGADCQWEPPNWLVTFFALWQSTSCLSRAPGQSHNYPISIFYISIAGMSSLGPIFSLSNCLSYLHLVHNTKNRPSRHRGPLDGARGRCQHCPPPPPPSYATDY